MPCPDSLAGMSEPTAVVFDIGNVLIRWDPRPAIAAAVGEIEADRFLAADDFDFVAWNSHQDAGRPFDEAESEVARTHPHWAEHARAYRSHFPRSLLGATADTVDVVEDLHRAGVPLYALTNWPAETLSSCQGALRLPRTLRRHRGLRRRRSRQA